jgi:hypothetical protein
VWRGQIVVRVKGCFLRDQTNFMMTWAFSGGRGVLNDKRKRAKRCDLKCLITLSMYVVLFVCLAHLS